MRYAELLRNAPLRVSFFSQETDDSISGQCSHLLKRQGRKLLFCSLAFLLSFITGKEVRRLRMQPPPVLPS